MMVWAKIILRYRVYDYTTSKEDQVYWMIPANPNIEFEAKEEHIIRRKLERYKTYPSKNKMFLWIF